MTKSFFRYSFIILLLIIIGSHIVVGQDRTIAHISGRISVDDSWEPILYISHIPTFEEMYYMSNKMIIAKTGIDSLGYFEFNITFLPKVENLYRLHIVKKGDTPATLIIGGKDENHMFLVLNRFTNLHLNTNSSSSPFKKIVFENSSQNNSFQNISNLVYKADSIASESSASKRALIEKQLYSDLLSIADTSSNFLVSLYAIYKSKFESNYSENLDYYNSYVKKWKNKNNPYYNSFVKQLPIQNNQRVIIAVILSSVLVVIGYFLGKKSIYKNRKIKKLSIQERRVYELLLQGASNQEIADRLSIGLSTTKSHVSSIYSKLNVKSRKEIINLK